MSEFNHARFGKGESESESESEITARAGASTRRRIAVGCAMLLALLPAACGSEPSHNLQTRSQAIAATEARVLGFEDPNDDWTALTGTRGGLADSTEGENAMWINPSGWTQVRSVPLSFLGAPQPDVTLDVSVPAGIYWGEVRLVLNAPSIGVYSADLGGASLSSLTPDVWTTVHFTIPSYALAALANNYDDLTVTLIFNSSHPSRPYYVDNLRIGDMEPDAPPPPPGHHLVMTLPDWALPRASALTALHDLRINDRVEVVSDESDDIEAPVANTGTSITNLGVESTVGNVTSRANITLRDRGRIAGNAKTSGVVVRGADTIIDGSTFEAAELEAGDIQFTLDFPGTGPNVSSSSSVFELAPGRYRRLAVQDASIRLSSGVYELDELYVAPQRFLHIDNSSGPVVVLVRDRVTFHGNVDAYLADRPDWILAYSGHEDMPFDRPFHGAIFAPNAKVNLSSSHRHIGSIIARDIEAHQDSSFAHDPYPGAWKRLCEVVGGKGGFCPQILVAGGLQDCIFALQPWVVGRDGREAPFPFVSDITFDTDDGEFVVFSLKSKRAMAHTFTGEFASFGSRWEHEISASAVAYGDVDGDGRQELLIGRSAHDNARLLLHDDITTGHKEIGAYLDGWGSGFGVKAIATGNLDADPRDEVAVARNASSGGIEVAVLDGVDVTDSSTCPSTTSVRLDVVEEIDIGDRDAFDVEIGDFDNDGVNELAIAKGGNSSFSPRIRIVEFSPTASTPSIVEQQDIGDWGASRDARALAVGDIQGDGVTDLAVGRSDGTGVRYEIYNFIDGEYDVILDGGNGWGDDRSVTTMTFGDIDANGDDELIIGRDGNSCFPDCDHSDKAFVLDVDDSGALVELASFGSGWDADTGTVSTAVGDIDGNGVNDILLGRSEGGRDRVLAINGPLGNFEGITATGSGWGDNRSARALAVSPDYLCQVFPSKPTVSDAGTAEDTVPERRELAVRQSINQFMGRMACTTEGSLAGRAEALFGKWDENTSNQAGRRIMAGLAAIQLGLDEKQALLDAQFLEMVDAYILEKVHKFEDVGTKADFDFQEMLLAGILYRFRTATLDGGSFLLSDEAVDKLLKLDCALSPIPPHVLLCPDRTTPHNLMYDVGGAFPIDLPLSPESENHILMINTWHYLVGQWVASASPRTGGLPTAPANDLEDKILDLVGRVVKNDLWETNARPYAALSLRAITLLASYAGSERVRTGAQNAADYLATKFAFQSLHGKRSTPMRRSWEYKDKDNLYEGDYGTSQFGILTGDYVFDTSPDCQGARCRFRGGQALGYALEASLMPYRVPLVVAEHMLRPDGCDPTQPDPMASDRCNPGHGSWARMQARFPEGVYNLAKEPDYPASAPGDAVEPTHEFYFRTADYVNAAGGTYEPYSTLRESFEDIYPPDVLAWMGAAVGIDVDLEVEIPIPNDPLLTLLGIDNPIAQDTVAGYIEKVLKGTDFLARPSTLIGGNDLGYWRGLDNAELHTLMIRGDQVHPWAGGNTGTYKNFTLGYSTDGATMVLSSQYSVAAEGTLGDTTIQVLDPDSLRVIFPKQNYYLVIGSIDGVDEPGRASLGFFEVIPRDRFTSAQALLDAVLANNSSWTSDPLSYVLTLSGETLTFNPQYPFHPPPEEPPLGYLYAAGPPFTEIDGSATTLADQHYLHSSITGNYPLIDVREVDENYAFTGVHFACSRGDGLVLVNHPWLNTTYVIDSRDAEDPKSCNRPFLDECTALLAGGSVTATCP